MRQKTNTDPSYDVLIVGAGCVGLVAALSFAKNGFKVALAGPQADMHNDGRTTALMHGSLKLLEEIGLTEKLAAVSHVLREMRLIDDTRRIIQAPNILFQAKEIGLETFGVNIANKDLLECLHERISDCEMVTRIASPVVSLNANQQRVEAITEQGDRLCGALVFGVDGRNSMVREACGIGVTSWRYEQSAIVTSVRHERGHKNVSMELHTRTGPFTLVPFGERRSSVVCVVTPQQAAELCTLQPEELALELERRCYSAYGKFTLDMPVYTYPIGGHKAKRLYAERVVLGGEAAHVLPPIGAQGMNLSFRDIKALVSLCAEARRMRRDIGAESLGVAYDKIRRFDVSSRQSIIHLFNASLTSRLPVAQGLRAVGFLTAKKVAPLRHLLMREGVSPHRLTTLFPV